MIGSVTESVWHATRNMAEAVVAPFQDPVIRLGVTGLSRAELPEAAFAGGARLVVGGREIRSLRTHYAEAGAPPGEPFAIWGSAGFLEISVDRDSAARLLGVRAGDAVTVYR